MKKNLWFAALVGVALTGCVSEESSPLVEQGKELTFASVLGTQTRANVPGEIEGAIYPTGENFSVFCMKYQGVFNGWGSTTTDYALYMNNVKTQHQGGANNTYWDTIGDKYYWPLSPYKLAFAAYSPSVLNNEASVNYGETGLSITDFRTEENSSNQYDLLYSHRTIDRDNYNNGNSAVGIKFKHALSSIVFSVQDDREEKLYTLKKLEVIGSFKTQGNFTQGIVETHINGNDVTTYSEAENPQWTALGPTPAVEKHYIPFNRTLGNYLETTHNQFELPQIFTAGTEALLMIPQAVPSDAKVILTFEADEVVVEETSPGVFTETKKVGDAYHSEYELEVPLNEFLVGSNPGEPITEWEPGVRYIYRFQFGGTPHIYFTPEVTTWEHHNTAVKVI